MKNKQKIEKLREKIENLDNQIFDLFEKRLNTSVKIGELKTSSGDSVYDPEREKEVIENVVGEDHNLPDNFIRKMMKTILIYMREVSQKENE